MTAWCRRHAPVGDAAGALCTAPVHLRSRWAGAAIALCLPALVLWQAGAELLGVLCLCPAARWHVCPGFSPLCQDGLWGCAVGLWLLVEWRASRLAMLAVDVASGFAPRCRW